MNDDDAVIAALAEAAGLRWRRFDVCSWELLEPAALTAPACRPGLVTVYLHGDALSLYGPGGMRARLSLADPDSVPQALRLLEAAR